MDWKVEIIMKWWETDINANLETVNIHSFRKSDYNVHVHTHLRLKSVICKNVMKNLSVKKYLKNTIVWPWGKP
jgi:hypothetical protein